MTETAEKTCETPRPESEPDPLVGREVGGYRIESMIGSGGLGIVYRAVQPVIDKPVAIKVLRWEHARDPEQVARLVAEAKLVSSIRHPGIVDVYTIGEVGDGRQFLAMELLEGESLSQVLTRGPLPVDDALGKFLEILHALAAAHRAGVVHRDLKPSNVFVVRPSYGKSYLKVLDFGLAKRTPLPGSDTPQTRASMIVGTPVYMAPEQARGESVGPRTDLYSAGVMLFEMLTGHTPFEASNVFDVIHKHLHADVPSVSSRRNGMSPEIDSLVFSLLEKAPARRPESAEAAIALVEGVRARLRGPALGETGPGVEDTLRSTRRPGWFHRHMPGSFKVWVLAGALAAGLAAGIAGMTVWLGARGSSAAAPPPPLLIVPPPPPVTLPVPPAIPVASPVPAPPATPPETPTPTVGTVPATPPATRPADPVVATPPANKLPRPTPKPTPVSPSTAPAAAGTLKLHVYPFADVYVDGAVRERGVMDFEGSLAAGRHTIKLVHPNLAEVEEAVEIVAGQTLDKRFKLVPKNGP